MLREEKVIGIARSWIGTRFHHQGRIKINAKNKGGCDCVGLVVGVCDEIEFQYHSKPLSYYDTINYGRLHRKNQLKQQFDKYFTTISKIDLGSILVIQINSGLQHCCIISEITDYAQDTQYKIIHCDAKSRGVVENFLPYEWACKIVTIYKML